MIARQSCEAMFMAFFIGDVRHRKASQERARQTEVALRALDSGDPLPLPPIGSGL